MKTGDSVKEGLGGATVARLLMLQIDSYFCQDVHFFFPWQGRG